MSAEELQKQQQLIETQIAVLRAEIAKIQADDADKTKESDNNAVSAPTGDGVNRPSAQNQINVYI
ncbi:putative exported protein [Yersinia pestis PY-15]|uniref:FlxA-like family protein n=1 Tax=Yersinia pestis TaxID=632 RepID=Q8CLF4_YERPE|nr:hypothetical [Yersinia pestis KIM10+]AAS62805.1 hypothetical protein YP_2612 [Yersinia pestis biovar Microtus str. 91001]EIR45063.1 putative exported protein [Yersinia pestis PY-15]EIS76761.1 putative exported protein [Yersinia pestis PY-72]EIT39558.1 putative exported protein [Yersinia pestis PY-99]